MALTCRANKVNRKFIKLALKFCCRMLICVFSGRLLSMPDICHFDRTQLALGPVYESVTHYEWLSAMRSPKVSARWCRSCMLVLVISEMVVDKVHKVPTDKVAGNTAHGPPTACTACSPLES